MDKDRFHNQLALSLGYERIVNDKGLNISIGDSNTDKILVTIEVVDSPIKIVFDSSENPKDIMTKIAECEHVENCILKDEINHIVDAVHAAYIISSAENLS